MKIEWPLPVEVARAIVIAAQLEGDDPIRVAQGGNAPKSRIYAFLALCLRFPAAPRDRLAYIVGWRRASALSTKASAAARGNEKISWFDLVRLNEVSKACGWSPISDCETAAVATWKAIDPQHLVPPPPAHPVNKRSNPAPKQEPEPKTALPAVIPSEAPRDLVTYVPRPALDTHEQDLDLGYRPDASADERGCQLHTAALMGDPPLTRSALNYQPQSKGDRRTRRIAPALEPKALRDPDEIFVERWQAEQAQKRIDEQNATVASTAPA